LRPQILFSREKVILALPQLSILLLRVALQVVEEMLLAVAAVLVDIEPQQVYLYLLEILIR